MLNRLIIAAALLGIASSLVPAQAQTVRPGGSVIDSQGWRYWNGQWDNTCLRAADWLRSVDACGGNAGG